MVYLTTEEIAQALRVPEGRIRRLCRNGEIPGAFKVGKSWRVPADVFDRMAGEL